MPAMKQTFLKEIQEKRKTIYKEETKNEKKKEKIKKKEKHEKDEGTWRK